VSFAQSSRTTIVARLLEGRERFTALNHYFGAGLLVVLLVSIAFGPLGGVVARLLTGDLPAPAADTARTALLLLWPAAALQVFAALGAAMLGALGDFLWAGIAFLAGSLVSIAAFLALQPAMGIDAVSAGMLVGSVVSAVIVAAGLVRSGWRPARATATEPREALRAAGVLTISSVSFLLAQFGFIVLLAVGARLGVGVVTVFSYSYMAMSLLQAVFVSSVPMVLAGPIAQTWDRRAASLLPHSEAVFRAGLLLLVPAVAAVALVGDDLGALVLADFDQSEVDLVVELFLILSFNAVWGLAATVPYAAALAIGRYVAITVATAGVVVLQLILALAAEAADSVQLLAAVVPVTTAVSVLATFAIADRHYPAIAAPRLGAILARLLVAAAVSFALPAWLLGAGDGLAVDLAVLLGGGVVFALIVVRLLPAERDIATRLAGAVPTPWARSAPVP
jgi:putative peptidoglycan lipid II flippase